MKTIVIWYFCFKYTNYFTTMNILFSFFAFSNKVTVIYPHNRKIYFFEMNNIFPSITSTNFIILSLLPTILSLKRLNWYFENPPSYISNLWNSMPFNPWYYIWLGLSSHFTPVLLRFWKHSIHVTVFVDVPWFTFIFSISVEILNVSMHIFL